MHILTLRTDNPQAEITLYNGHECIAETIWQADRQLAETLHSQIVRLLHENSLTLNDVQGLAIYQGPGSFTGLRIGIAVANSLAYAKNIPIIGCADEDWQQQAIGRLLNGQNDRQVLPFYGAEPNITVQKK